MMGTRYVSLSNPLPLPGLFRDSKFSMEPLLEHLVWKAVGLPHGEQAHPESSRVNASLTGTPLQELTEKYTAYVDKYLVMRTYIKLILMLAINCRFGMANR